MENKTAFDLSVEIQKWRTQLLENPGFRNEDIEELECHLRDAIRDLQIQGLTQQDAFLIATRRIGSPSVLASEFARTNGPALWSDRMLWMLIGWAAFSTIWELQFPISDIIRAVPYNSAFRFSFFEPSMMALPFVIAGLLFWAVTNSDGYVPRLITRLLCKPTRLSLTFFLIGVIPATWRIVLVSYITPIPLSLTVRGNLASLVHWAVVAIFIFLLSRSRQRMRIAGA